MPPLAPLDWTNDNRLSAMEQVGMIACVYANRRALAQSYLGSSASILRWVYRPDSWPPSWALIRNNNGAYHVVIAGTSNVRQWVGHAQGAVGVRYPDSNSVVNAGWFSVAEELLGELQEVIPDLGAPNGPTIQFSGHSYGGAVAYLAGLRLSRPSRPHRARVMTIGAPKIVSGQPITPSPSVAIRIASTNDPVAAIPPDVPTWGLGDLAPPLTLGRIFPIYQHVGDAFILNADGSTTPGNDNAPSPLPDGVALSPTAQHGLRNYWGRIRAAWTRSGTLAGPLAVASEFADAALADTDSSQTMADDFGESIRDANGQLVSFPFLPPFISTREVLPMSTIPVPSQSVYKYTFFFNWGRYGWSESYFAGSSAGLTGASLDSAMKNQVTKAIDTRLQILHPSCALEAVRFGPVSGLRGGRLYYKPSLGMGVGKSSGQRMDDAADGIMVYFEYLDGLAKETRILRGMPADFGDGDGANQYFNNGLPANRENPLVDFLRQVQNAPEVTGLHGVCRGYDRTESVRQPQLVTYLSKDERGHIRVHLEGQNPFALRDRVHLSVDRDEIARGLSGEAKVIDFDITGGDVAVVLDRRTRVPTETLTDLTGRIEKRVDAYYRITSRDWGRMGSQRLGSAFFVTRGRRRGRSR